MELNAPTFLISSILNGRLITKASFFYIPTEICITTDQHLFEFVHYYNLP
jgi:hypothetical protein